MKILYISRTRLNYSLNAVYINGLRQNGVEVLSFKLPSNSLRSYFAALDFVRKNRADSDLMIVGYDSSSLAVFLRPFYRKKMVYCAVLPIYERLVVSRKLVGRFSPRGIFYWLIDFLAFHFADATMMESKNQIDHASRFYFTPKRKFIHSWIGVDENNFFYDPETEKFSKFTVLFRGVLMPEAGFEQVIHAAKILEGEEIDFLMLSGGLLLDKAEKLIKAIGPSDLKLISNLLSYDELRTLMQKCHLSLGQLSDHERLERTVPHKVFESLAMKLPYLTAANPAILELLKEGETCLTCVPADTRSLADRILWAKNNYHKTTEIAENGYRFFTNELGSANLARNLLNTLNNRDR